MNETSELAAPPPPPPPPPARRLARGPGGMLGGVCEGLGRYFDVDPVLFRIGFVVAAVAGGSGLLAYLVMWVVIPHVHESSPIIGAPGPGDPSRPFARVAGIVLVAFAVLSLMSWIGGIGMGVLGAFEGPLPFIFIVAGGVLLWWGQREDQRPLIPPRDGGGEAAAPDPVGDAPVVSPDTTGGAVPFGAASDAAGGGGDALSALPPPQVRRPLIAPDVVDDLGNRVRQGVGTAGAAVRSTVGTYRESPRRPRSILGRLTVGIVLLLLAGLATLHNLGVLALSPRHYLATALVTVGVGLLAGTFFGRSRPLILLGLLLLPITLGAATVFPSNVTTTSGQRTFAPVGGETIEPRYELGIGELTLDLRQADVDAIPSPLSVHVSAGELLVLLPSDPTVHVDWSAVLGEVHVGDQTYQGGDLSGSRILEGSDDVIDLNVSVGLGSIRIVRD